MITTLSEAYYVACNTPSDINEHLPTLRYFSSLCSSVTEMGVRTGVSSLALLSGVRHRYTGYDVNEAPKELKAHAERIGVLYQHHQQDTTKIKSIPKTDLLFIDTLHTYKQLKTELNLHGGSVLKYILLHDTATYGHCDENATNKSIGLIPAIENWLADNPQWIIGTHHLNNNGLMILINKGK